MGRLRRSLELAARDLPALTHYDIVASPVLVETVERFLAGKS